MNRRGATHLDLKHRTPTPGDRYDPTTWGRLDLPAVIDSGQIRSGADWIESVRAPVSAEPIYAADLTTEETP